MKKILVAAALFASACGDRATGPERSDPDAIQIAYFADLINAEPSNAASAYCVSFGATWAARQNPSDDVLADLRRLFGKVQPASACVSTAAGTTFNGEPARSYHIETATQSGNTATVTGYFRPSDAVQNRYQGQLEKQGSLWIVSSFQRI